MKSKFNIFLIFFAVLLAKQSDSGKIQYLFPGNNTSWNVRGTPVIVRFRDIHPVQIYNYKTFIQVYGEKSGHAAGSTVISSDRKTLIFKPEQSYFPGEKVTVNIKPTQVGQTVPFLDSTISFTISPEMPVITAEKKKSVSKPPVNRSLIKRYSPNADGVVVLNGVSVPSDFPYIDITINNNPDPGYIFCNYDQGRYFNMILDNTGAPIFYWIVPDDRRDFRVQPTGVITMTVREGFGGGGFIAIDNTYTIVDTFFVPDGFTIDEHELLVLPNGHYLVTAMQNRQVDMSELVPGGKPNATVIDYHLLEMDANDNPVFIWYCHYPGHYEVTDAEGYVDLTQYTIDYLHTNSIAVDLDGHYLICPKLLNEITKINRYTGDIIWRLGGNRNQFDYVDMDDFIYMQHSIRVLPNGNYTVFDNGNYHSPHYSRALEFSADTTDMTVTKVWEFRDSPDKQSFYKGNVQRLPNGNTLINWGMQELPKLTEVTPEGTKAFEMNYVNPIYSYRVFKFPWEGCAAVPFLVVDSFTDRVVLLFNKFGDNDIEEYRVYGGATPHPEKIIGTTEQPYMVLTEIDFIESSTYYFRVTAVNSEGGESDFSNEERVETDFMPAYTNMVRNNEFDSGMTGWYLVVDEPAAAEAEAGNNECHIDIQQSGPEQDDIRLFQGNHTLYNGQKYSFEFDAWSDQGRVIDARIESSDPPFTNYGEIGSTYITTERNRYTFTFDMNYTTTDRARVIFYAGLQTQDVYIDNVVLMRINPSDIAGNQMIKKPEEFVLNPIYPNPFNQDAAISFTLSSQSNITIEIIDLLGRRIDTITRERLDQGHYIRLFHASNYSTGLYFCRMTAESVPSGKRFHQVRRMVILK